MKKVLYAVIVAASMYMMYVAVSIILVIMLAGCKSVEYIEKVRTDTTYITKQQRDSIWLHDSLYIHEYQRGDTIYLERTKWVTKYRERLRVDTFYKAKTDTLIVEKVVEKKTIQSWWQRLKENVGGIALLAAFIALLIWIWKTK